MTGNHLSCVLMLFLKLTLSKKHPRKTCYDKHSFVETCKLAAYGGHCSPFGGEGAQIVTFPVCLFILLLYQISFIALVKNDIGLYVWRTNKHLWQTNKHLWQTNKHVWRTNKHLWQTNKHIPYSKKDFKNIFCLKSCSNSFFWTPWVMTDP